MPIQSPKNNFLEIVCCLWEDGEDEAHKVYSDVSIEQFKIAGTYFDSFRCEGCHCGSCVPLLEFANDLENCPNELKPLAQLAIKLAEQTF